MLLIPGIIASSSSTEFAPTDIANLELWLDASDTSTITLSGSDVTQWDDKSGKGYSFTQGTAAYRPQSGTRTQNSLNVLDFGTNDALISTAAASTWKFFHDGTEHTTFIAFKSDANSSTFRQFLSTWGFVETVAGVAIQINPANNFSHVVVRAVAGTYAVLNATSLTSTNFTYVAVLADPDNGTTADRSDIRIEQGSAVKNNTQTQTVSAANPGNTLRIGDPANGENVALDGMIAEIIVYKQLLSAGDLLDVQNYLKDKWGL